MAIRRPPTTFSDTISTADIADDAISGDKLANDISISTTGNIVTTGSGALTVAGNTTLSGTNNLGSNPTVTLGSNATLPANTVHYITENKVTSSGASSSPTAFTTTGLTIDISSSEASKYSKIYVTATLGVRATKGTSYRLYDFRLIRTAPSESVIQPMYNQGSVTNTDATGTRSPITFQGVDSSLGSGTHTYRVEFRKGGGSASYTNTILYLGEQDNVATITAYGII